MSRLDTIIEVRRLEVCEAALKWLAIGPNATNDENKHAVWVLAAATQRLNVALKNRDRIVKKGGA